MLSKFHCVFVTAEYEGDSKAMQVSSAVGKYARGPVLHCTLFNSDQPGKWSGNQGRVVLLP